MLFFNKFDDFSKVFSGWKSRLSEKLTKIVYNEASIKKIFDIIKLQIDLSNHVVEKDLGNDIEFH